MEGNSNGDHQMPGLLLASGVEDTRREDQSMVNTVVETEEGVIKTEDVSPSGSRDAGEINDSPAPPFPRHMNYDGETRVDDGGGSGVYDGKTSSLGPSVATQAPLPPLSALPALPALPARPAPNSGPFQIPSWGSVRPSFVPATLSNLIGLEKQKAERRPGLGHVPGPVKQELSIKARQARQEPSIKPTQELSTKCQKEGGFNPLFFEHVLPNGTFSGLVKLQGVTVEDPRAFGSRDQAKVYIAAKALKQLEEGTITLYGGFASTKAPTNNVAGFPTRVATRSNDKPVTDYSSGDRAGIDTIPHGNGIAHYVTGYRASIDTRPDINIVRGAFAQLDGFLSPTEYGMRRTHSPFGPYELELRVTNRLFPGNITLRMNKNWAVVFVPTNLEITCQACVTGSGPKHPAGQCPRWVVCERPSTSHASGGGQFPTTTAALPVPRRGSLVGGGLSGIVQGEVKKDIKRWRGRDRNNGGPKISGANTAALAAHPPSTHNENIMDVSCPPQSRRDQVDRQTDLIRSIQELMGPDARSGDSQDPVVKAAFLDGIALGARLAATVPKTLARRSRSRSPGRSSARRDRSPRTLRRVFTPEFDRRRPSDPSRHYWHRSPLRQDANSPNLDYGEVEPVHSRRSVLPTPTLGRASGRDTAFSRRQ